ncbi:MAG: putative toxin-antitoxin system toxin component, PIN family [Prevotellaceae bacterium]|nr:putative toxin-antitoxin system toxin component, PIN family [Candidatus Faecinaster equi]
MICAVIDTNVFVSALITPNPNSPTIEVYHKMLDGTITPLYNKDILNEYKEVLSRPHFKIDSTKLDIIFKSIRKHGISSDRVSYEEPMLDESDRVFYEIALSKDDAYLVTGNLKHFPKAPIVVTPAQMLDIIRQQEA